MSDISKFEERFNQWRGRSASKEQYVLNIATKIASFNNENNLQNIQVKLTSDSVVFKDFDYYRKEKQLSCLFGTLFYMKLVIEDYTKDHEALPEDEKQTLKNVLETLDALYNYTYFRTGTKLENLTSNINSWLEKHAPNNENKDKTKELCLAFYTIITIINLNLETIPKDYSSYVATVIGDVNFRKEQMTALLNQIIQIISKLEPRIIPAPQTATANIDEEIESDSDESTSISSIEEQEEFDSQSSNTNSTGTPEPPGVEEQTANPTQHEEPSDNSTNVMNEETEEDSDEFYDAVSEQPTPITLEEHFDALSFDVLTNAEGTLQNKIQCLKMSLAQTCNRLNQLIEQKTKATKLGEQFNLATKIDLLCKTETYAHDIVGKNKDDINTFLMLMPAEEQDTWRQRLEKIAPPDLKAVTTHKLGTSAKQVMNWMPESNLVNTAKSHIPIIDKEFKTELQALAHAHMQKLYGTFNEDTRQLSTGALDDLKAAIDTSIKALASENDEVMSLLQNTPLTKLNELITKININQTVITEYEVLVNLITETRAKLKTTVGIDADIDIFLSNYDSFLVRLSLFVSHYLGSFFKTATADKIDKVSVIKTQIHESKIQLQTRFEDALNSIKNNQQISETIKATFVAKLEASLEEAPAQEPAAEPRVPEIQQATAQSKIDKEFHNICNRFTLFAPPAPVDEIPASPLVAQRVFQI